MSRSRRVVVGASFISAITAAPYLWADDRNSPGTGNVVNGDGAIDVTHFGAVGDGLVDDSKSIARACAYAITCFKRGKRCFIRFPSGFFMIKDTKIPLFDEAPIGIRGNGTNQSVILIDAAYQGDVFSWANCWYQSSYGPQTLGTKFNAGAFVEDIGFLGTRNRETAVNAITFYGINDNVRVHNVQFDYLLGSAISIGNLARNSTVGIMRESRFGEIRIFSSGTRERPCIEVGSAGSSDATNELSFSQVDIFKPGGHGMVIHNVGSQPVRLIKIFGLRIESFPDGFCGLQVGDQATDNPIYGLNIVGLELISGHDGSTALALVGTTDKSIQTSYFQGQIVNCKGDGVLITAGKGNRIDLIRNECHRTGVTIKNTASPLYYQCSTNARISVDNASTLLTPAYTLYRAQP